MYSPQKRQVGSAFALTYRLRLRSCKLLDAFVISSLPPILLEPLQNSRAPLLHGHYSASPLLRARPSPSRLPPISRFTPVIRVPAPPISRRGEEGFSSCSVHPCHRAVATAPPECPAASVSWRRSMLPSPYQRGLGLCGKKFRGHLCVHFRYGPMTRSPSPGWLCR